MVWASLPLSWLSYFAIQKHTRIQCMGEQQLLINSTTRNCSIRYLIADIRRNTFSTINQSFTSANLSLWLTFGVIFKWRNIWTLDSSKSDVAQSSFPLYHLIFVSCINPTIMFYCHNLAKLGFVPAHCRFHIFMGGDTGYSHKGEALYKLFVPHKGLVNDTYVTGVGLEGGSYLHV